MIQRDRAKSAADEVLAAAMLGADASWADALQQLADAAEAGGTTLMHLHNGRPSSVLSSTGWIEADAALLAGHAPPSPRRFFPDHVFGCGFLGDIEVWGADQLLRDQYFQEFLRPRGVFYHAKARLLADGVDRVSLSLKRFSSFGPYEPPEIAALDRLLPRLRMAVRIAQRVLDAEASGMARVLHGRGDPVFELDSLARVVRVHGGDAGEHLGVAVRGRRILTTDRRAQVALDRAVAAAVRAPEEPAVVAITGPRGERGFVHVMPVVGRARDVFLATSAFVVVIEPGRAGADPLPDAIRRALGLTSREAQIATMLSEGSSLTAIAERLQLGQGTVRNHVKSIFAKTDTRRQGELIALLCKLQR